MTGSIKSLTKNPSRNRSTNRSNMISMTKKTSFSLVSLAKYLARLKPQKLPRDETSLVVSNLGCRHYYLPRLSYEKCIAASTH